MPELGLVSCTKTKLEDPAPPGELYALSTLFSKASQYCDQEHDDWYILSAKHHLLEPDGPPIEPYDETLTGARVSRKRKWAKEAFEQLESAGLLEETEVTVQFPVEGLLIGERLGWYNERI